MAIQLITQLQVIVFIALVVVSVVVGLIIRREARTVNGEVEWKTVTIPACEQHHGMFTVTVTLPWVCPVCGGKRGEIHNVASYDGSLRMVCDGWNNPCGHVDRYTDVRKEYGESTER